MSSWLESHTNLREHPKRKRFSRLLGLNMYEAIGLLHVFWWWVLEFAPEGDLRAYSDEDLADAIDFDGDAGALVAALTRSGFLDADRHVHDWEGYAEKWIERRRANARRMRDARASRNGAADDAFAHVHRTSGARAAQNAKSVGLPTGPDLPDQPTGPDQPDHPPNLLPEEGGTFPVDVGEHLSRLPDDLDAAAFHTAAESALGALGFACRREVWVDDRGDGRRGRLDLLAERHGVSIALELDDRSPRRNSLDKLVRSSCTFRVVVLRCPYEAGVTTRPDGIVVIGAGRMPGRAVGLRGETADGPSEVPPLAPLSPADVAVWGLALDRIRADVTPANADLVARLEPLGRAGDGGLRLRAPPGQQLARFSRLVAVALTGAGDVAGSHAAIVETG